MNSTVGSSVQPQVPQEHIPVLPMEENTVHRNAKGVDFLTLHPKAFQLWHHILAGNHIGVHIGGNPGPVHAVIRQDADEGTVTEPSSFKSETISVTRDGWSG